MSGGLGKAELLLLEVILLSFVRQVSFVRAVSFDLTVSLRSSARCSEP